MSILFLHIPKAAGTYVDSCVKQSKINSVHAVSSTEALKKALGAKKDYIAGHFTFHNLQAAQTPYDEYKLVTVIRNPIDRFISDVNYHVEIIKRGEKFLQNHSTGWQGLIKNTYESLAEAQESGIADFSHLSKVMLREYLASRLLTNQEHRHLRTVSVKEAAEVLERAISRFSFFGIVENGGADSLLNYVSSDLNLDISACKPNANASTNYVPYDAILPTLTAAFEKSEVSNMLHLMLTQELPTDTNSMDWQDVNQMAIKSYISGSRYRKKEICTLPQFDPKIFESNISN